MAGGTPGGLLCWFTGYTGDVTEVSRADGGHLCFPLFYVVAQKPRYRPTET